ncbi:MAG: protein kinase [archaeon]
MSEDYNNEQNLKTALKGEGVAQLLRNQGRNYGDGIHFRTGGIGCLYAFEWGPEKDIRIAKVDKDKEDIVSYTGRKSAEKGHTTKKELEVISKIEHPGAVRLLDYFTQEQTKPYGFGGPVLVHEYFANSQSVQEKIEAEGALSVDEALKIYCQVARTIAEINNGEGVKGGQGMFHRDLKHSNILVRGKGEDLEVKIADWANANEIEGISLSYSPTGGGREVTQPFLYPQFTGKAARYDDYSEAYALVAGLAQAIRGRPIFRYDFENKKVTEFDTGLSILDENTGMYDGKKVGAAVKRAADGIAKDPRFKIALPLTKRKALAQIIENGLSFDYNVVYKSAAYLYWDLKALAEEPSLWEKSKGYAIAAGLVGAVATASVVMSNDREKVSQLEAKVVDQGDWAEVDYCVAAIQRHWNENKYDGFLTMSEATIREDSRIRGWLDIFCPWDYSQKREDGLTDLTKRKGDFKMAFAAYIDSRGDQEAGIGGNQKAPMNVWEAIKEIGVDPNDLEAVRHVKYEDIEDILSKKDHRLTQAVFRATRKKPDYWSYSFITSEPKVSAELWEQAGSINNRIRREAARLEHFKEQSREQRKEMPGLSVGPFYEPTDKEAFEELKKRQPSVPGFGEIPIR